MKKRLINIIILLVMMLSFTASPSSALETVQNLYTKKTYISLGQTCKGTIEPNGDNEYYYVFSIPTAQKVRIYIGNYKKLNDNYSVFYLFKSDDILSQYRDYTYISKQFLATYDILSEFENPSAYSFNLNHLKINTTTDGTGYIDKFLPIGTYYLGIKSFSDANISYSVNVSDMPKSALQMSAKKAMEKAKIKKLKVKSKTNNKITVAWKRIKKANGYQVQISKNKRFKNKVLKKISPQGWFYLNKTKKLTIKNLKSGTKYYIRVRAYATYKDVYDNKKRLYGPWSKVKSVKTKALVKTKKTTKKISHTTSAIPYGSTYVLNSDSMKVHISGCRTFKYESQYPTTDDLDWALRNGYSLCGVCLR